MLINFFKIIFNYIKFILCSITLFISFVVILDYILSLILNKNSLFSDLLINHVDKISHVYLTVASSIIFIVTLIYMIKNKNMKNIAIKIFDILADIDEKSDKNYIIKKHNSIEDIYTDPIYNSIPGNIYHTGSDHYIN